MTAPATISALILAGGRSSRMGQDKALIEVEGRSLLQRVYDTAAQCCPTVYVVTQQPERYQSLLPDTCLWIREEYCSSNQSFPGPLVAFAQALEQIDSDWVLLLACDLPFLEPDTLQGWARQAMSTEFPPPAWVPCVNQRWEPLCAIYHRSCAASLRLFVQAGGRSFQTWLAQERVHALRLDNAEMLHNCNVPEDLARVQNIGR